jgi:hypothetical protein
MALLLHLKGSVCRHAEAWSLHQSKPTWSRGGFERSESEVVEDDTFLFSWNFVTACSVQPEGESEFVVGGMHDDDCLTMFAMAETSRLFCDESASTKPLAAKG